VNSQNRMNAGAEYALYRIWAALQDENGIHAESLLTCLGALAGYACQACVRQNAALAGADPGKYALTVITTSDGTKYLHGDALNMSLVGSPRSIWALVGRAVQKLGEPLPDIDGILRHVTQTLGTSAFGVVRAPDEHRPRHPPIVYLEQIWPQILPIAQRFCRKPAQLPVLFGIALQRAIEQTQDKLSPTLGASIAMECAVAMSRVALPEASADHAVAPPTLTVPELASMPKPMAPRQPAIRAGSTRIRATSAAKRKSAVGADASAANVGALIARLPPAKSIVTIMSVAIIAIAGALWRADQGEAPETAREERKLQSPEFRDDMPMPEQPIREALASQEEPLPEEVEAEVDVTVEVPNPTPDVPSNEGIIVEDAQSQLASSSGGSGGMLPGAETVGPLD